jgi:hypothetical protein
MPEPADEYAVALRVAGTLERIGIEYVLGGSLASSLQGEPRSTNGIDFAVRLTLGSVPIFARELGSDFSVDEQGLVEAVRLRRSENIFFLPSVTKIDLFVRGGRPFDEREFARKVRTTIGQSELFVASPEDNILRKLVWFRMGGETSDRQWRDVLGLFRTSPHKLDFSYMDRWATDLGVADLLRRAAATSP